jgi:hypothetical protein
LINNNSPGAKSGKREIQLVNGHKLLPVTPLLHCAQAYIVMVKDPVTQPRTWDFTVNCISPALNNLYRTPGSKFGSQTQIMYQQLLASQKSVKQINIISLPTVKCKPFQAQVFLLMRHTEKSSQVVMNTEECKSPKNFSL